MKKVLMFLRMAMPFVNMAAEELANIDDNDTGPDDRAAAGLRYAGQIISSVVKNTPIPVAPAALTAPGK